MYSKKVALGYDVSRRMYVVGGGDMDMYSRPKGQVESMKTCCTCRGSRSVVFKLSTSGEKILM